MKRFVLEEVKDFIWKQSQQTKIYLGCDSYRFKKNGIWMARYTTVVVVHINGKNGCRIFGKIDTERDFDAKKNKPIMRMMNEVYRSVDMYNELKDSFGGRDVSIHIDINPSPEHGSNVAYSQAMGYIKGTCGIDAKPKPDALASSFAADHFRSYKDETDEEKIERAA